MIKLPEDQEMKTILQKTKRIAVVGLSDKPSRTSYQIAHYLLQKGYEIIPVNPQVEQVFGIKAVKRLADITESIDIVNVFRRSEFLTEVAEETIDIGAPVFWAQLGLSSETAYHLLKEHNITPIMDRCIMVEHRRLLGV
ncbi:CoA-binding protein [Pullulanibacillus sp. KACC 23026]|uniref:CoA-binding protein n=1 Tax=Pullulanibacillus sp. KACC 23026 TaxID=3028315 RepID=UPI0023B0A0FE|nr:CoA-binding protein [Pullulanibacillus sp. KACC 23026]WEG10793.1 CoA-binding protein [Pullulanibacillus sp. KACC 23026]